MASESTSLLKTDDITKTIQTLSPLDGGYTEDTFENNKWGYKLASTNYIPFVSGAEIARSDTTTNGDTTQLTFATKVDFLQSAGVYKTELNFVAVANPLPTYIQNLDATMCTEDPLLVVDKRDNQEYSVVRLADGNCWMMDNLNLGAYDINTALTERNTNISEPVSAATFNSWRKESGSDSYASAEYIPLTKTNSANGDDIDSTSGTKFGTLYNYCAASAGTICVDSNDDSATYDICPAGWRLPKGGSTYDAPNEFNDLYTNPSYNTIDKMRAPVSEDGAAFALAGWFTYNRAPDYQGGQGYYWTSTMYGSSSAYNLFLYASNSMSGANIGNSSSRTKGYSIRCILKPSTLSSVVYLQDVTPEMVNRAEIGTTKTLKDRRDNEEYLVGKLDDGNLWLLDNLRLDLTQVSLGFLKDNTNASYESLHALKFGGGESPQAVNGVSTDWTGVRTTNWGVGYSSPYVYLDYKDTVASTTYGNGSNKYGVYYNYCAATAGSYCYPTYVTESGVISEDICPSGWRLPKGEYNNGVFDEFGNLHDILYAANGNTSSLANAAFNEKLSVVFAGDFYDYTDGPENIDNRSIFWTSTWAGTRYVTTVQVGNSGYSWPHASTNDVRDRGVSVRCIFNK